MEMETSVLSSSSTSAGAFPITETENIISENNNEVEPVKVAVVDGSNLSTSSSNSVSTATPVDKDSKSSFQVDHTMHSSLVIEETDSKNPEEESPIQQKKRSRLNTRDNLSLSPEMTATGKRQRRVNSLYSVFSIDKKVSQVLGSGSEAVATSEVPDSEVLSGGSSPGALDHHRHLPPLPRSSSSEVQSTPQSTSSVNSTSPSFGKRDLIMSPIEAIEKKKKLPKGYTYEPVIATPKKETIVITGKRERKKTPYRFNEFEVSAKDSSSTEVREQHTSKQKEKSKSKRGHRKSSQDAESFSKMIPKKAHTHHASFGGHSNKDPELLEKERRKRELEIQLTALESQIASVSQSLQLKSKEPLFEDASHKPRKVNGKKEGYDNDSSTSLEQFEMEDAFDAPSRVRSLKKSKITPKGVSSVKSTKSKISPNAESFTPDADMEMDAETSPSSNVQSRLSIAKSKRSKIQRAYENDSSDSAFSTSSSVALSSDLRKCLKLLIQLRNDKVSWPFNQPVDPVALNIPDYFEIIKQPMDFGTIMTQLKAGEYNTSEEFAEDVRLVFTNAFTYNPPGSDIVLMAQALKSKFERDYQKLLGISLPVISPEITEKASVENLVDSRTKEQMINTITELKNSMKFVQEEIQHIRQQQQLASQKQTQQPSGMGSTESAMILNRTTSGAVRGHGIGGARHKTELRDMTFEEKRLLSVNISNLPPENVGKIVQIIHQRRPELAQNASDEIEIDIDSLDTGTLRSLERYVKQCLSKRKRRSALDVEAKLLQAQVASLSASQSMDAVKNKLKELQGKQKRNGKSRKKREEEEEVDIEDDTPKVSYPTVLIEKDKESSSSSSSDSSSDDESSSSTDSESSSSDKNNLKKEEKTDKQSQPQLSAENNVSFGENLTETREAKDVALSSQTKSVNLEGISSSDKGYENASNNTSHGSGSDKFNNNNNNSNNNNNRNDSGGNIMMENPSQAALEISLPILQPIIKKEIELKNLDAWKTSLNDNTSPSSDTKESLMSKDETWFQFQNRDQLKKQREREREEQEERERRERIEKEAERKRLEEQRLKEIAEAEDRKRKEDEEAKIAGQRRIAEKRAAEKQAREQVVAKPINLLDQSIIMSSFEQSTKNINFDAPSMQDLFKLKELNEQRSTSPPSSSTTDNNAHQ